MSLISSSNLKSFPKQVNPKSPTSPSTLKKCGICLEEIKQIGSMDNCKHLFCLDCILKWSKVTNLW